MSSQCSDHCSFCGLCGKPLTKIPGIKMPDGVAPPGLSVKTSQQTESERLNKRVKKEIVN